MDDAGLSEMLREDRAEWDALVALLDAHTDRALHGGESGWASRDVYAHLARWMEHSTADLQARLEDLTLPPLSGTEDEINARWQQADSVLSFAAARERAHAIFERRLRAIQAVPPTRWSDKILEAMARADGANHYRNHRSYIMLR
ncbi:MAG: maleylpyruvate isomerase N-terminal domain-containing protein [Chloroflexota bacterium]|nr:maleylpyruvate isomerase N-terminal domain-containing protein [Chloroflexota bacterium]